MNSTIHRKKPSKVSLRHSISLDDFFISLDEFSKRIPLDYLIEKIEKLRVTFEDVKHYAIFSDNTYRRNLMREGEAYQALVLCWMPGQRSPIHDHRGSSCAVRVLRGVATESTFYMNEEGYILPVRTEELSEGVVAGSQDMDIHQVSNLQKLNQLVTLHIYSPPLIKMGTYSLERKESNEFIDPIYELGYGI